MPAQLWIVTPKQPIYHAKINLKVASFRANNNKETLFFMNI